MGFSRLIQRVSGAARDLASFGTREAQDEAWKAIKKNVNSDWRGLILSILSMVPGLCLVGIPPYVLGVLYPGWTLDHMGFARMLFLSSGIGGMLVMYAVPVLILRPRVRRLTREYLNAHGLPICLHCGYNLRGLSQPRCPECGRAFEAQPGKAAAADGEKDTLSE